MVISPIRDYRAAFAAVNSRGGRIGKLSHRLDRIIYAAMRTGSSSSDKFTVSSMLPSAS